MITAFFVVVSLTLVVATACLVLLIDMQKERKEKMELLRIIKEWVEQGKNIRQDVRDDAGKVALKAEQLAVAVGSVPAKTADMVVEKIAAGDSGKLPPVEDARRNRRAGDPQS